MVEPPSREAILRLCAWLAEAELPDPPLALMPGVTAYDVERLRSQILAETASPVGPARAVLDLRFLAARCGPPEIAALARPEQVPRAPRRRQV